MLVIMGIPALAQDGYVSSPIVHAMEGGKFYLKMGGSVAVPDNDMGDVSTYVELASRGGVSMSRTHTQMVSGVMLTTDQASYILDESAKTWRAQPSSGSFTGGRMEFTGQGECLVNGESGWYYDEYRTRDGSAEFTFYYNTDKVSLIEVSAGGEGFGVMNLQSFSTTIPSNMYFCVGKDWKQASGGTDALAMAGIDRAALEQQIRESLKGEELPPGMTIDDIVNMSLSQMGGGAPAAAPALPGPPVCSKPWTDSGTSEELAAGGYLAHIAVTGKQKLSSPIYASAMPSAEKSRRGPRLDRNVTEEGIKAAAEYFLAQNKDKSGEEIERSILAFNEQAARALLAGTVTGELVEMAIAECKFYKHPSLYNTTGSLLLEIDHPQSALTYFEEAVKMEPGFTEPYYGLIESHLDMDDLPGARSILPKLLDVTLQTREDGRYWLYKAMLANEDDSPYMAADDLFKSLSLGYFDENSALLLNSLLTRLDIAQMNAIECQGDFPNILESVFTEENLDNIRKGISWGRDENYQSIKGGHDFSCSAPVSLESNRVMNRHIAEQYTEKDEKAWKKGEKAMDSGPGVRLCLAMGFDGLADNIQELYDAAKELPETRKAVASNARARKLVGKLNVSEGARSTMENGYRLTSLALAKEYNVDGFFIPDDRTFWCLYTLDRYYHWRMANIEGAFGAYDDEKDSFSGVLPPEYKEWARARRATNIKYRQAFDEMSKRQNTADSLLALSTGEKIGAWDEAHPHASAEVAERAHKRISKPLMVQMYYTHPIEKLDNNKVPELEELLRHDQTYFNKMWKPLLEEWWADVSKYAPYCYDSKIAAYFWFRALSEIYGIVAGPYYEKASDGESIAFERAIYEKWLADINEQEWHDRQAAAVDFAQSMQDERDEKEFKDKKLLGFNDLTFNIGLPCGDLCMGIVDGEWGCKRDIDLPDVIIRPEPMNSVIASQAKSEPFLSPAAAGFFQNIVGLGMQALSGTFTEMAGGVKLGTGSNVYWDAVNAATRAAMGKLVDVKNEQRHTMFVDSAGNLRRRETSTRTVDMGGYVKWTTQDTQIGRIKRRKDIVTASYGFFSVSGGSYAPKLR